ncbi:MAG: hypothetical protein J2P46_19385 [Zavarzinella sp.]|nr:hypothetical protein [Zavarzinella sp.]
MFVSKLNPAAPASMLTAAAATEKVMKALRGKDVFRFVAFAFSPERKHLASWGS